MLHAIIDIGSNTVRMAIYDIAGEQIDFLMKKKDMVGLAAYVENNVMTKAGIDKVCEVLFEYKKFLEIFQIKNVAAFTTAALRNCSNSQDAVGEIIARTGIDIEVISGDKEAEYDFIGATKNLNIPEGILIDIGGGSTELVHYAEGKLLEKVSLPMGSLDFRTRYCSSVFPNSFEADLMAKEAWNILAHAKGFMGIKYENIVGIGGTFKGTAALYNAMYSQEKGNTSIKSEFISHMTEHFVKAEEISYEDTVLLMKNVPDRINTIVPGMIIANVLVQHFGCKNVIYSDSGVREGFIYAHLAR